MTLAPITGESRRRFRLDDKVQGVVVTEVDGDSPAGEKNIRSRRRHHRSGAAEGDVDEEFTAKLEEERAQTTASCCSRSAAAVN